jgi:hypothetical protein
VSATLEEAKIRELQGQEQPIRVVILRALDHKLVLADKTFQPFNSYFIMPEAKIILPLALPY